MEEEEEVALVAHKLALTHTHAHTHTHTHTLLSHGVLAPSTPPLSGSFSLLLAGSYTVEWGFSVPSPHHIHTQTYTLSLKFSHSHAPRCCISQLTVKTTLCSMVESWRKMQKCGGTCATLENVSFLERPLKSNVGVPVEPDIQITV